MGVDILHVYKAEVLHVLSAISDILNFFNLEALQVLCVNSGDFNTPNNSFVHNCDYLMSLFKSRYLIPIYLYFMLISP